MNSKLIGLCRYGLYLSVLLVLYGTLFPFHFDFSTQAVSRAWAGSGLVPFWDVARGRIHSLPDMVSNVVLTVPLGFFGFLWFGRDKKRPGIVHWFFAGFGLGLISEIIQLGVASRLSDITDALNNGIGTLFGAIAAAIFGTFLLDLLSGSLMDRRRTSFFILAAIIMIGMLLPFDFTMDVSGMWHSVKALRLNPWKLETPISEEWIQMAEFAILGALAGSIKKGRIAALAMAMPFVFEAMQILVESHGLSLRDPAMNFAGVAAGITAARFVPALVQPVTGFTLMSLALIAQGLSPYHFGGQSRFEWIPLVEYYSRTTGAALYDAMSGLLSYGLLVALWPRRIVVAWAILLAVGIEAAQIFVPTRFAGTTDILIAAIGACAGYAFAKAATDYAIIIPES
jgi:glycopeptide antibiotics resistance protein